MSDPRGSHVAQGRFILGMPGSRAEVERGDRSARYDLARVELEARVRPRRGRTDRAARSSLASGGGEGGRLPRAPERGLLSVLGIGTRGERARLRSDRSCLARRGKRGAWNVCFRLRWILIEMRANSKGRSLEGAARREALVSFRASRRFRTRRKRSTDRMRRDLPAISSIFEGGGPGTPWWALERAASAINLAISKVPSAQKDELIERTRRKRAKSKARGTARKEIRWKGKKTPKEYLCLPANAYNTLDERWIQKIESADDHAVEKEISSSSDGRALFVIQVPLDLLAGVSLRPRIWIESMQDGQAVQLLSRRAEVGDARLDACFDLALVAKIRWHDEHEGRENTHGMEVAINSGNGEMEIDTRVSVGFIVPQALSFMPRVALGSAGSVVMKAVLKALLPRFLDLLVADYQRWAEGSSSRFNTRGRLFPPEQQMAESEAAVGDETVDEDAHVIQGAQAEP